jgi:hypothetical protein
LVEKEACWAGAKAAAEPARARQAREVFILFVSRGAKMSGEDEAGRREAGGGIPALTFAALRVFSPILVKIAFNQHNKST